MSGEIKNPWAAFGASVIGASHIRKNLPNQDAYGEYTGEPSDGVVKPTVAAVSDGHGSSKYIRSGIGSKLAAEAMIELAAQMSRAAPPEQQRLRISEIDEVAERIKMQFLNKWQRAVDEHFDKYPFTAKELSFIEQNCSDKDRDSITENSRVAYGCTFLAVIAYADVVLAVQYGDGDILGLYPDGAVKELIPEDPRNMANETLSLCKLTNPAEIKHRVYTGSDMPILITLSTDGIKNSFDDINAGESGGFKRIPTDIKGLLIKNAYDKEKVRGILAAELERITLYGAGDDVTLGVLFNAGELTDCETQ